MGRRRRYTAVAVVVTVLVVVAALLLPTILASRAHPRGFGPANFMRHITGCVEQYVARTGATTLPGDLRVVSDFMDLRTSKDLAGYSAWQDDIPFERIRYVGADRPVDPASATPVLVYRCKPRQHGRLWGLRYYLDHRTDFVEGDEWLAIWEGTEPVRWE